MFITRRLLFTRRYRLFIASLVADHFEANHLLKHQGADRLRKPPNLGPDPAGGSGIRIKSCRG